MKEVIYTKSMHARRLPNIWESNMEVVMGNYQLSHLQGLMLWMQRGMSADYCAVSNYAPLQMRTEEPVYLHSCL